MLASGTQWDVVRAHAPLGYKKMARLKLTLTKPHRGAYLGIELSRATDEPPLVTMVEPDFLAAQAGLAVGMRLLAVNDSPVIGYEMGMALLRQGAGDLILAVATADATRGPGASSQVLTVQLHKPSKDARTGIVLTGGRGGDGQPPIVKELKPGGIAAASALAVGMTLLEVNGQPVLGHKMGTQLIKEAEGVLHVKARRAPSHLEHPAAPSPLRAAQTASLQYNIAATLATTLPRTLPPTPPLTTVPALTTRDPLTTTFQHRGEPLLVFRGHAVPFAVYEREDSIKIVISTFNLQSEVSHGEGPLCCTVILSLDETKRGHSSFFQCALRDDRFPEMYAAEPPLSCRVDIVKAAYISHNVELHETIITNTRVKIILAKARNA